MTENTPNSKNNAAGELPEVMLEEAAIWQARLREPRPGTPEERGVRAEFSQWLLADTRHRQAFAEMESFWGRCKRRSSNYWRSSMSRRAI